jgi:hypothetical protein
MTADRVEVSWDPAKTKWLVRIQNGEEIIRRHCDTPQNADEMTLRAAAEKTVRDEGYDIAAANIIVRLEQAAGR